MNSVLLYFLSIPIMIYLILTTPIKIYEKRWFYKIILVYCGLISIIASLISDNVFNNKYILPFLLFLNLLILFHTSLIHEIKYINLLPLIGILYLLCTFNYKDFEFKNGLLIKPNKNWIYSYVILLILYFFISDFIKYKFSHTILVLYPLFFPLDQYFIHRGFSLSIVAAIFWKYKSKYNNSNLIEK